MREETQQPSQIEQAARRAAERAAAEAAKKTLIKIGAIVGAKGAAVVAAVVALIALLLLLVTLLVAVAGAAFQSSTAVWPAPVATDAAGAYQASGWTISSRYGWRDNPQGSGIEFHDGLDLANPQGICPFGYHCGVPSIFDGTVQYLGWDQSASGDPSKTGGGMMVIVANGQEDHQSLYAHLEPYRLYVQLQGAIQDRYGRYDNYRSYRPIGTGALQPDLSNGGIAMTCLNDMPNFIPTRSGPGAVVFVYDRPANCTTTVVWGERGDGWQGWTPDDPSGRPDDRQRADLRWQTPLETGKAAGDVALRFRAHLVPPPPPPTATPSAITLPTPALNAPASAPTAPASNGQIVIGRGSVAARDLGDWLQTPTAPPESGDALPASLARTGKPRSCTATAGGWVRCVWALADIPTERERFAAAPDPWIVAAQAATSDQPLNVQEDAEAPVDPALLPSTANAASNPVRGSQTATPESVATPARTITPRISAEARDLGGPAPEALAQAKPAAPSIVAGAGQGISVVPALVSRLLLHDPATNRPEYIGVSMTISDRIAEQVQIDLHRQPPGIPASGDVETTIVDMPAGTLQNYAAPGFGLTVPPNTAPGVQVCVTLEWKGLTSGASGAARVCTVTADPGAARPTPPAPSPDPPGDGGSPDCAPLQLVRLPNVTAPNPRLVAPAAASFAAVRADIQQRAGVDALAALADALRQPAFTTPKPGVLQTSWHKAGRAIDLNQGGPFVRVAEGRRFRLYVNNVDITAIFEAHGWQRIPVQGDTLEWWHYEWHPDGIAWTSAMRQAWDLPTLRAAFPDINWAAIGCAGGSNEGETDPIGNPQENDQLCMLAAPHYSGAVETIAGCGPPVRAGDKVYQLDTTLGFVGLTGRTTGPHLHMGLRVKSYSGSWPYVDICTSEWLQGRTPPPDGNCYTDMADPLAFLPRAPGNSSADQGDSALRPAGPAADGGLTPTAIIPEGAPYQLPPPNYPGSLAFTPQPAATPAGQYWSPYADGGRYGGGGVGEWFCSIWSGWPWCN